MTDASIAPADTREELSVTDSLGRTLRVKRLSINEELDLIEAAGDLADNRRWFSLATLAATVRQINEIPQPKPSAKAHIRACVARVGSEGIAAVVAALTPPEDSGEALPGERKAAA